MADKDFLLHLVRYLERKKNIKVKNDDSLSELSKEVLAKYDERGLEQALIFLFEDFFGKPKVEFPTWKCFVLMGSYIRDKNSLVLTKTILETYAKKRPLECANSFDSYFSEYCIDAFPRINTGLLITQIESDRVPINIDSLKLIFKKSFDLGKLSVFFYSAIFRKLSEKCACGARLEAFKYVYEMAKQFSKKCKSKQNTSPEEMTGLWLRVSMAINNNDYRFIKWYLESPDVYKDQKKELVDNAITDIIKPALDINIKINVGNPMCQVVWENCDKNQKRSILTLVKTINDKASGYTPPHKLKFSLQGELNGNYYESLCAHPNFQDFVYAACNNGKGTAFDLTDYLKATNTLNKILNYFMGKSHGADFKVRSAHFEKYISSLQAEINIDVKAKQKPVSNCNDESHDDSSFEDSPATTRASLLNGAKKQFSATAYGPASFTFHGTSNYLNLLTELNTIVESLDLDDKQKFITYRKNKLSNTEDISLSSSSNNNSLTF